MTVTCPKCGQPIAPASINVAQDVAFCAACGEMHRLSVLSAAAPSAQTAAMPQTPAQPVYQQTTQYQQAQQETMFIKKTADCSFRDTLPPCVVVRKALNIKVRILKGILSLMGLSASKSGGESTGKCTITSERISFKTSAFVSAEYETLEIMLTDVDHVAKEKALIGTKVVVTLKSGQAITFHFLSGADQVIGIIEQQLALKRNNS
jgi:hypothetical protein